MIVVSSDDLHAYFEGEKQQIWITAVPFNHFWVNVSVDSYHSHFVNKIDVVVVVVVVVHDLKAPDGCRNYFEGRRGRW